MCEKCDRVRDYVRQELVFDFPEANEKTQAEKAAMVMAHSIVQNNVATSFYGFVAFYEAANACFAEDYAAEIFPERLKAFFIFTLKVFFPGQEFGEDEIPADMWPGMGAPEGTVQ